MLKNLVGIVTGAASGIGKATASALVQEGCKVFMCDLPKSHVMEVSKALGSQAVGSYTDIREPNEIKALLDKIQESDNRLDFIVNCAGMSCAHPIFNVFSGQPFQMNRYERVMNTNLKGTFNMIRSGIELMYKTPMDLDGLRGVIVNVTGIEAFDGQMSQVVLAAASGAITSMTLPLARDLQNIGIRVVTICTGIIKTPLTQEVPLKVANHISNCCIAPKRMGEPEEVAHAVKFVIENKYINGSVIRIDAGLRVYF